MDDRKPPRKSFVDEDEAFILQVLRYVDNVSSAEEEAMLERELSTSAERRSQFVEICQRCWNMRESVSQSRLADQFQSGKDKDTGGIGQALAACLETMPIDSARGKSQQHSTRQASRSGAKSMIVRFFASPMRAAFAVAAILLVAALPTWFAWRALSAGGTIAVLTSTTDAKWNGPDSAPTVGDSFAAGTDLQLVEGVAEITLSSGANVCVAGPAVVELDTPMAITLRHGSLVSTVPVRAVGFTVNTPDSRVVDKGTTFGVTVPDNGQNEVHVFKGRVDAFLGFEADGTYEKKVDLSSGQAVRFDVPRSFSQLFNSAASTFSPPLQQYVQADVKKSEFSERTYALSQSYGGQRSPGTFQVEGSSIRIRPGYDNTACVMLDGPGERLQAGSRVDVLAPALKDKQDGVFLMVSTVAEQPDGASSFGLRLRRDTRGIWLMPAEHPDWRNALTNEEMRKDIKILPDPGGPLLLTIERTSDDTFRCSYRKVGGEKSVLVGEFVSSALGSHRELYVGVQAYCHNEIHNYVFRRLQIVPIKEGANARD